MGSPNFSNPNPELLQSVEQLNAQKLASAQARSHLAQEDAKNLEASITAQRELAKGVMQDQVDASMGNARLRSERRGAEVLSRGIELMEKFPARDLNHLSDLPLEGHRAIVRNLQEGEAAFEDLNHYHPDLAQQIAIAQPAPSGPLASIIDNPDGTFSLKLQTGEIYNGFKGENREALLKLGESKVQTRRHYEAREAELARQANNGQRQPAQQPPAPQSQSQPGQVEQPSENQFGEWVANEQARALGYKDKNELVSDWREKEQLLETFKNQQTVSEFFMHHPDYPNSEQANAALDAIISGNGWNWTPETMGAAHALAVQNRMYQPLSREEIAVANGYAQPTPRPTPPPMIMGGSPEGQQSTQGPWEMPLDQLRKQALAAGRAGER